MTYKQSWYQNNKAAVLAQQREYRSNNKEKVRKSREKYDKQYRIDNKEKIKIYKRAYQKEYDRKRLKNDINYKLRKNLRKRVWDALNGNTKSLKTFELIGCSTEQLKQYLQTKFTINMCWKNYGQWHVDHIKPCSSFDLTELDQQKECFHYSNLQPLWAIDNIKKGDKL